MINQNLIKIIVLNQRGEKVVFFGQYCLSDINKLVEIAEKNNMCCLGFIDLYEDTYFNEEQSAVIKEEIKILRQYKELNENLLDTILAATDTSIRCWSYIKIVGLGG